MLETTHHWLPIIIAVYLPVSFVITYSIAVGKNHIEPWFPYISDTGITPPESCVFSQLLNIGAVIAGVIIYIRYRQVLYYFEKKSENDKNSKNKSENNSDNNSKNNKNSENNGNNSENNRNNSENNRKNSDNNRNNSRRNCLSHLNTAALITGILTIFGVSLVGNFQKTTVTAMHYIGAFLAFGVGLVYMILQTIISYKSASFDIKGNDSIIRGVRIALCVADAILLIMYGTGVLVSQLKGPGLGKYFPDWSSDEPGYAEHLLAAISQWLVALVTVIYFATFFVEFKNFKMKPPEVVEYNENEKTDACCPVFCSNVVHP